MSFSRVPPLRVKTESKDSNTKTMKINLDNYESFFLLYVDNELSAPERKNVEEFLGEYPYLQEEMNLLKETVLRPEEMHFDLKAGLLKPLITEEALQENLLLHLDNELAGAAKQDLETLLLADDKLQQEWALLKRTKLDAAEAVVFPDKNSLFRHERGRLVIGRFARWAVAAAIIAGGSFIGVSLFNKQSATGTEIAGNNGKKEGIQKPVDNNAASVKETKPQPEANTGDLQVGKREENVIPENENLAAQQKVIDKNKNSRPVKTVVIAQANAKKIPNKKPFIENKVETATIEPGVRQQDIARINKPPISEPANNGLSLATTQNTAIHTDTNIQPVENLFARNASMGAEENNNDNHIFMMDEERVSRTKAAGFFKKIKRTVERTTKIKPGSSLKIAGFEFAVK
jgi:hypothetical protein